MTHNLHTVTITGADDAVDPRRLLELSKEFPFAEWGVLRSATRDGSSRYPSEAWRQSLRALLIEDDRAPIRLSMHLCGRLAREAMGGSLTHLASEYDRFQLNGWSNYLLPFLLVAKRLPQREFIAQCVGLDALEQTFAFIGIENEDDAYKNVSVLWDPSGGSGLMSSHWPQAPAGSTIKISYAGGINAMNVQGVLNEISRFGAPFGIDLESGARTDDKFDLDKVWQILQNCRSYVEAAP